MTTYYQKASLVMRYLKGLGVHPVTIAEAVAEENYQKSYQLITANPRISKQEFLQELKIEEYED